MGEGIKAPAGRRRGGGRKGGREKEMSVGSNIHMYQYVQHKYEILPDAIATFFNQ